MPRKDELVKYRLWKQQDNKCIYSGNHIYIEQLCYGSNATQIDHAIPMSRSFDDSMSNKVLCLTSENQNKRNQTPYEYIGKNGADESAWHLFVERINHIAKIGYQYGFDFRKRDKIILRSFNQEGFIDRNLNDGRYIARFMMNYLRNHLMFSDSENKQPVRVLTGQATAFIRKEWGLVKKRDENDLHHAQDACVIAATSQSLVQKFTNFTQQKSYGLNPDNKSTDLETGEVTSRFPMPKSNFRSIVISEVAKVFVSRMPNRRISGSVHDDTVRSCKYVDNPRAEYLSRAKFSTVAKPLANSGIKHNAKTDNIDGLCPTYKLNNINIYNLIKQRLINNDNDCKKAFAEPLHAPRKNGEASQVIIKKIKTYQIQNTGVRVNNGIADNGGIIRVDVFNKAGKIYLIPIYQLDAIKSVLPNTSTCGNIIDDSYIFTFSLFPKDLIKIYEAKTPDKPYLAYLVSLNAQTGQLIIENHDKSEFARKNKSKKEKTKPMISRAINISVISFLEKYGVNILGEYQQVKSEKRILLNANKK